MRRSRHATVSGQSRGQIVDAISIRERPAEVEDRAIPGHWEGDLLSGAKNSYIATLVERHSRFAMLIKVPSKETEAVVAALSQHVRKLPATLKRSLTWDRGLEMAKRKDFTVATDVQVYFCDPQSPWQRGLSPIDGSIDHGESIGWFERRAVGGPSSPARESKMNGSPHRERPSERVALAGMRNAFRFQFPSTSQPKKNTQAAQTYALHIPTGVPSHLM